MNAGLKSLFIVFFYFQTGAFYVAQVSLEFLIPTSQVPGFQMLNRIPGSLVDFYLYKYKYNAIWNILTTLLSFENA